MRREFGGATAIVVALPGETPKTGLVLTVLISLASMLGGYEIAKSDPEPETESDPRLATPARVRYVVQGLVAGALSATPIRVGPAHPTGRKNFMSWPLAAISLLFAAASRWTAWEGIDPEDRSS